MGKKGQKEERWPVFEHGGTGGDSQVANVRKDPKTRNYLLGEAKRDIGGGAKIEVRFFQ